MFNGDNIHNYHLKVFIKQKLDLNRETPVLIACRVLHAQWITTLQKSAYGFFSPPYIEGKFLIAETLRNYIQWPIKSKTQRKTNPVIGLNRYWFQGAPHRGAVNLNEGCVETDGTLLYVHLTCAQTFSQWEARLLSAARQARKAHSQVFQQRYDSEMQL